MRCSLYIHIPFCRSKCRYCDFYSITETGAILDEYIDALGTEWDLRYSSEPFEIATLFIGGGTPSMLTPPQWERLHEKLLCRLQISSGAECTVESNPESLDSARLDMYFRTGITRLSVGIQSLCDRELDVIGRPHTAAEAISVLRNPALERFASVGADIMYGLPGQTPDSLAATIAGVCAHPVITHISAYELTIADATPFGRHRTLLPLPSDDATGAMAEMLHGELTGRGFEQYEVSNFAKPGHRCRHNCAYWSHDPYIGLGCAAHSFVQSHRYRNICDVAGYCTALSNGRLPVEDDEFIDPPTLAREMVFLRLRTTDGLNEETFSRSTGLNFIEWAGAAKLQRFIDEGMLIHQPPRWQPTRRGLLCADYLARELF